MIGKIDVAYLPVGRAGPIRTLPNNLTATCGNHLYYHLVIRNSTGLPAKSIEIIVASDDVVDVGVGAVIGAAFRIKKLCSNRKRQMSWNSSQFL